MKLVWQPYLDHMGRELHLHDESIGRYSYVGLLREHNGLNGPYWVVSILEWFDMHPLLEELDEKRFDSKLKAMRAMRTAFTVAWITLDDEQREDLWDGWL